MMEATSNGRVELYHKHRPRTFKEVRGQDEAVESLKQMLRKGTLPHFLVLTGSSGVGKTTVARILADKLKATDFREINAASTRGIDVIRDILETSRYAPIDGGFRIWLVDECFHGNTLVGTPCGSKQIDQIREGDEVWNVEGTGKVEVVFCNRVNLSRVLKLTFDEGTILYTTKQHRFLTNRGWVEAEKLGFEDSIFCDLRYNMGRAFDRGAKYHDEEVRRVWEGDSSSHKPQAENMLQTMCLEDESSPVRSMVGERKETPADSNMPILRAAFSSQARKQESMLLQILRTEASEQDTGSREGGRPPLPGMRGDVPRPCEFREDELFAIVRCKGPEQEGGIQGEVVYRCRPEENKCDSSQVGTNTGREGAISSIFGEDETEKSRERSEGPRKGKTDQGTEGNSTCLAGGKGREREDYSPTGMHLEYAGGIQEGMVHGFTRQDQRPQNERPQSPYILQGGCRQREFANSHRDRWERASVEQDYITRQEENSMSRRIRLVRSEVYQRGCNDSSFLGVISDTDRDRGFVEFFDLQVSGHPSYLVEGMAVHNCHMLTLDAMTASLKLLEDYPTRDYFIFATTRPDKIIKTIMTRACVINLKPLGPEDLSSLVMTVASTEGFDLSPELRDSIVEAAQGGARKALTLLHGVMGVEDEGKRLALIQCPEAERQAIEVFRGLLNPRKGWPDMQKILLSITEEPETVRQMVLSCCNTTMLQGKPSEESKMGRAAAIVEFFERPFHDAGKAGLTKACWDVLHPMKG